jgi:NADH:ubiquinone reductase (H+-translocating)
MPRVVVLGAGYAGAHAARAVADAGVDVLVVDPDGRHEFGPRLAAVAAGAAPVGDGWAELSSLAGVPVRRGAATAIQDGIVTLDTGDEVAFDALVVTVGAGPSAPDIPGLDEHALLLKTATQALRIRALLPDTDHLVVVGAGPTGVQLAGEAAAAHPHLTVTLVEEQHRLMPTFPAALSRHAERILRRRGVRVICDQGARRVDATGVVLDDGRHLDGVVAWCGGFQAAGNALLPDAPSYEGRLVVDRFLRVSGRGPVFAAGDIARHRDILGRPLPMSAQIAVQAGAVAGANAARAASDQRLRPARLYDIGWLVTLGGGVGVGQVGPFHIAAPLLDRTVPLLHDAIDIRHLFTIGGLPGVLSHAPGRFEPSTSEVRRAERPVFRTVG